jgi:hypothetical protein
MWSPSMATSDFNLNIMRLNMIRDPVDLEDYME